MPLASLPLLLPRLGRRLHDPRVVRAVSEANRALAAIPGPEQLRRHLGVEEHAFEARAWRENVVGYAGARVEAAAGSWRRDGDANARAASEVLGGSCTSMENGDGRLAACTQTGKGPTKHVGAFKGAVEDDAHEGASDPELRNRQRERGWGCFAMDTRFREERPLTCNSPLQLRANTIWGCSSGQ